MTTKLFKYRAGGGLDLELLAEAAGASVSVKAASPVVTSLVLEVGEDADEGATTEAMASMGYTLEGEVQPEGVACPLVVIGQDDGRPYAVSVVGGVVTATPLS